MDEMGDGDVTVSRAHAELPRTHISSPRGNCLVEPRVVCCGGTIQGLGDY